jgi:hypothetical protein
MLWHGDSMAPSPTGGSCSVGKMVGRPTTSRRAVKPIHHVKTGQLVANSVWAGWENGDGSFNKGRYTIYCWSGDYTLEGDVQGTKDGVEQSGQDVFEQSYQSESFVWWLADAVCKRAK